MKTTRTYLTGCTWCGATGFVPTKDYGMGTTPSTIICPVCNGAKTIIMTETIEDDWLNTIKDIIPKPLI